MRRLRIAAACVVAAGALLAACGGHAHKDTTPVAGDAMDTARRAAEVWRGAWEGASFDAIAPLYVHDKNLVMVAQGVALSGWDKIEAHLHEVLAHAHDIHVKLDDVQVDAIDDDCAVIVASMARDISDGTVTTSERGVVTLVLHRESGAWLVVSEHFSYAHAS